LREGDFSLGGASQARHIAPQDAVIVAGLLAVLSRDQVKSWTALAGRRIGVRGLFAPIGAAPTV
jgi:hypothetical protein